MNGPIPVWVIGHLLSFIWPLLGKSPWDVEPRSLLLRFHAIDTLGNSGSYFC